MAVVVTFEDWLELLGLDVPIAELLAGNRTLTSARDAVADTGNDWPSVSQDYVSILGGLEPFFEDVSATIAAQRELVEAFNRSIEDFAPTFPIPDDRLLNQSDLEALAALRDEVFEALEELANINQAILDEINALLEELASLAQQSDEEEDPFFEDDFFGLLDELEELTEALEAAGCPV